MEKIIDTGHTPEIHIIGIGGDLVLRGWDEDSVQLRAEHDCEIEVQRFDQANATHTETHAADAQGTAAEEGESQAQAGVAPDDTTAPTREDDTPARGAAATDTDTSTDKIRAVRITIECPGDCVISVPYNSRVRIGSVGGDCNMKELGETLSVEQIGGDCRMVEMSSLEVDSVGGDCLIQNADGHVTLNAVGGDLRIHEAGTVAVVSVGGDAGLQRIHGSVNCTQAGGDLRARAITGHVNGEARGDVNVAHTAGNINVQAGANALVALDGGPAQRVNVHARADIRCRMPAEIAAQVHARSRGGITLRNLPVTVDNAHDAHFYLGEDDDSQATVIDLDALGSLVLEGLDASSFSTEETFAGFGDFGARVDDLADHMSRRLESRLEHLSRHLEQRLTNNDELAARIQEKVQNAMRQAERKIAKALEKAESRAKRAEEETARREARHAERAQRAQRRNRSHTYSYSMSTAPRPPVPPVPPTPPRAPKSPAVSEEERMRILRMVEQGTISVEQAEKLLAALHK